MIRRRLNGYVLHATEFPCEIFKFWPPNRKSDILNPSSSAAPLLAGNIPIWGPNPGSASHGNQLKQFFIPRMSWWIPSTPFYPSAWSLLCFARPAELMYLLAAASNTVNGRVLTNCACPLPISFLLRRPALFGCISAWCWAIHLATVGRPRHGL